MLYDWVLLSNVLVEFEDLPNKNKYGQRLHEKNCWVENYFEVILR